LVPPSPQRQLLFRLRLPQRLPTSLWRLHPLQS